MDRCGTVTVQIAHAEVVGYDQQDIGPGGLGRLLGAGAGGQCQRRQCIKQMVAIHGFCFLFKYLILYSSTFE